MFVNFQRKKKKKIDLQKITFKYRNCCSYTLPDCHENLRGRFANYESTRMWLCSEETNKIILKELPKEKKKVHSSEVNPLSYTDHNNPFAILIWGKKKITANERKKKKSNKGLIREVSEARKTFAFVSYNEKAQQR